MALSAPCRGSNEVLMYVKLFPDFRKNKIFVLSFYFEIGDCIESTLLQASTFPSKIGQGPGNDFEDI